MDTTKSLPETLMAFYDRLSRRFGKQNWWPGDSAWEVVVGAILTQNTNWRNVEKALNSLKQEDKLRLDEIREMPHGTLSELIRSSGYHNIKAKRLKNMAEWWATFVESDKIRKLSDLEARRSLLKVNGVGEETADSILLYALDRQTFVVDAYTRTFLLRHRLINDFVTYMDIKYIFEQCLPREIEIYKEYHALIVALGKANCKRKPICTRCPLSWHLDR